MRNRLEHTYAYRQQQQQATCLQFCHELLSNSISFNNVKAATDCFPSEFFEKNSPCWNNLRSQKETFFSHNFIINNNSSTLCDFIFNIFLEHTGCVNRLVWSDDGKVLASCSDDLHICLWNMEWKNTQPCSIIPTSHKNNIFCVKFIPQRENKVIVTGSMDSAVEIHTLADDLRSRVSGSLFYCHKEAVKYIEVEPQSPNVFFSVGEDGCVRQYDFRIKSLGCQVDTGVTTSLRKVGCMYQSPNCLLKCKDKLRINSMKICPVNNNLVNIYNSIFAANSHHFYCLCTVVCPGHE